MRRHARQHVEQAIDLRAGVVVHQSDAKESSAAFKTESLRDPDGVEVPIPNENALFTQAAGKLPRGHSPPPPRVKETVGTRSSDRRG